MILSALIRALQSLEEKGYGRNHVAVDKDSLADGNGTFNICKVYGAGCEFVATVDGDGAAEFRKDGTEKGRVMIVLSGELNRR